MRKRLVDRVLRSTLLPLVSALVLAGCSTTPAFAPTVDLEHGHGHPAPTGHAGGGFTVQPVASSPVHRIE